MQSNKPVDGDQSNLREFLKTGKFFILPLVPVFLSLMLIYSLNRLSFSIYHAEKLQDLSAHQWIIAALSGLRFDLAATAPFILVFALILPIKVLALRRALWWMWSLFAGIFILMNGVDSVLIDFTGRRFSRSLLLLAGEGSWLSLFSYQVMATVTFCLLAIFLWGTWKGWKLSHLKTPSHSPTATGLTFLAITVGCLVAARGGLQVKPIGLVDAKILDHHFAHQVILNSSFTFISSLGRKGISKHQYFDAHELKTHLNRDSRLTTNSGNGPGQRASLWQAPTPKMTSPNVVIFILESFSQEYMDADAMPFLQDLKQQGAAFFPQAYANGRRSIEGIVALFAGIPALMENPFLNSEYATNQFIGLGQLFKNKNYHTSFFHGAENGSMRFDRFTHSAGFDHYFGKTEFYLDFEKKLKNKNDAPSAHSIDDGTWGIFDEPMLEWACAKQSEFARPFASSIFTLSSHHPFKHPDHFQPLEYRNQAPQLEGAQVSDSAWTKEQTQVLNSIAYTDYALKRYFECAESQPWFNETIFIFVGDHTGPTLKENPKFQDLYHIVFGFYSPLRRFDELLKTEQYAQQIDLVPTLNELLDLNLGLTNHLSRSLLQPGPKSIVFYSDQRWEIIGDAPNSDERLKAFQQYFSEAMLDNRLYQ